MSGVLVCPEEVTDLHVIHTQEEILDTAAHARPVADVSQENQYVMVKHLKIYFQNPKPQCHQELLYPKLLSLYPRTKVGDT